MQIPHLPVRVCKLTRLMWGSMGQRTKICGNSNLPFTMVPSLPQSNVYINRNLRVWRVQICIPLVGAKTTHTCAGLQTNPSHVRLYSGDNGNLRVFGSAFRHGNVFAPKECLYQKEATDIESPKIYSSSLCKHRTYMCGPANLPHLMWCGIAPRTEICGNSGLPFAMVPCLHQSNV